MSKEGRPSKRYLMLAHDQDIDRRIIQQARALQEEGWSGTIVCLSHSNEDIQGIEDGLDVYRIGLSKIIPTCQIYQAYTRRQQALLEWCYRRPHSRLQAAPAATRRLVDAVFRGVSKVNWWSYKAHLLAYYNNRRIACPLPFDGCFFEAGSKFQADLIVAHDLPALAAGVRLAGKANAPLVYDAHELYYEQKAFSTRQKDMMRQAEGELIAMADAAFTVNDSIADEMVRRYGCRRPGVLLNVIDAPPSADAGSKNLLRERLKLSADKRILLFQGGLLPNRNLRPLLEAMKYVRSPQCVLVFMGNGPLAQPLCQRAARERISDRVAFVPAVPAGELIDWTSSADVGIIPYPAVDLNTRYCTPNKLFEYIQAQVPILANDLPELRRYVRQTAFGLTVPMSDARSIAAGIDRFLGDPQALRSARENLSRRREEFTWSSAKRAYLDVIRSLVAGPRRQARKSMAFGTSLKQGSVSDPG